MPGVASMRWRTFAASTLLLLTVVASGASSAETETSQPGCVPSIDADINGAPADAILAPSGSTGSDTLAFDVTVGVAGDDCPAAVNSPPLLLGAWVDPSLTRLTASFEYRVTYVDLDNDAPRTIQTWLDGRTMREMIPVDPGDTDYRDGAVYSALFDSEFVDNVLFPAAFEGDHWARLEAHDGVRAAEPVTVTGPRIHDDIAGSLLLPNPADRLFIHPIANGPTFTPPSEVLPPAGMLAPEADGVYSHTFPIDPEAASMNARWSVGTGTSLRLRGYGLLEDAPGASFTLGGPAAVDPRAHIGSQAVDLAPPDAVPDGSGRLGVLHVFPNSETYRLSLVGTIRLHVLAEASQGTGAPTTLGVWLDLDADGDRVPDVCVGTDPGAASAPGWTQLVLTRDSAMRVLDAGCTRDATLPDAQDGVTSLDDIQDIAAWGLLPILHLRVEALTEVAEPRAAGDSLLVDSLALVPGIPSTTGDVDACLYGTAAAPPASPAQPLSCVSDIGPNSGPVPAGATHANVWADQMVPVVSTDSLVPRRPYLEPLAFSFSYSNSVPDGPPIELPSPNWGRVFLAPDTDGDGMPDAGQAPSWESPPLALTLGQALSFSIPLAGPDDVYGMVLVYETGRGEEQVALSLPVQRFVNDQPSASLSGVTAPNPRVVTFTLGASDDDESQSGTARALGGLRRWGLSFGDGTSEWGMFPMPASIRHTYKRPGDYATRLTVEDFAGATATADVTV